MRVSWPQDTGFRAVATKSSLTYIRFNPAIALKLAPNFSIGGGVTANYAKTHLESGLTDSTFYPNHFVFDGSGWGVGYNLGLLWQPHETISIGASFRSSTSVTLNGDTDVELLSHFPAKSQSARKDFKFPLDAVFGISCRPTPKWNLEFDADYTDWSSVGTTTIYQQGDVPLGGPQNPPVTFNWQASWMYEFGVTRYFDNGWHASAGFVYNENSVPNEYYTPLVADLDRYLFSLGAGRKGKMFDFDVAYQLGYGPAHTVTGSNPSSISGTINNQNADGTYNFISHAVMLTVGMHF
jgi:long-chain fatty acid transport protein